MNNSSSNDNCDNTIEVLTPEDVAGINTVADLWTLARMVKDLSGDPIWEVLYQTGCNPQPFESFGYNFEYYNFKGIYIPMRNRNDVARLALPKLASVGIKSREKLMELVNIANSLVSESKFTIMGEDVWLIHERKLYGNEDYTSMIEHILESLKSGAELFYKIS